MPCIKNAHRESAKMHTDLEPDTPPQVYRPLRWPDDSVPPKTLLFYKRRLQETPTVKLVSYRRFTYKKTTQETHV